MNIGPFFAASLEHLAHAENVASLSLFYGYYFGRCSSKLAQLVPLPSSRGRSTRWSDRLHDFSVTISRERETETEGDRDRDRDRETDRETERDRDRQRQRQREAETERDTERQRQTETER